MLCIRAFDGQQGTAVYGAITKRRKRMDTPTSKDSMPCHCTWHYVQYGNRNYNAYVISVEGFGGPQGLLAFIESADRSGKPAVVSGDALLEEAGLPNWVVQLPMLRRLYELLPNSWRRSAKPVPHDDELAVAAVRNLVARGST